jgi:hypothetical protein
MAFPIAAQVSEKNPNLTTTDGKTYDAVTVTKVEPDGIKIIHESGVAKVPFEKLSVEIQKQYGFDPEKAEKFREAQAIKQEAANIAAAKEEARVAAVLKADAENKALAKKAVPRNFKIIQVINGGYLADMMTSSQSSSGSGTNGSGGGVVVHTSWHSTGNAAFVTGWPETLPEGRMISGKFAEIGTFTYEDTQGASRTISKYKFLSAK